ncbi:PIN domain-containing protein [Stieleria sp. ICT_E10.1]|uniref:PIN domain-containing protein n=1 Tax=Stieleria sedimenti TaxID=2976331 RepID=UPI00217F6230|nr:PIN domain-containing protein [Stieleria sedimenti]MCS7466133.1 PIN domain-containing protein [Stieleria sedimenti]
MKDKFPGYYPPNEKEEKLLWDEAIFVFDTCSLLNLYSYSDSTRDELLGVLNKIKDRLWMPYQVASELHKNRVLRIAQERKNYADTIKSIDAFRKDIDKRHRSKRQHPFISNESFERLVNALDAVQKEMEDCRDKHDRKLHDDSLFENICSLFGSNVGNGFDEKRHSATCEEGKKRYKAKRPPGYMDGDAAGRDAKPEPDRYGDLVLWYETIDHAKSKSKPVVFVTDDSKEDWWRISPIESRKTLGPRAELIEEFIAVAEQKCWLYSSESFVSRATDFIKVVSTKAQSEVKNIARSDTPGLLTGIFLPSFKLEDMIADSFSKSQREREDVFAKAIASVANPSISPEAIKFLAPTFKFEELAKEAFHKALAKQEVIDALKDCASAVDDDLDLDERDQLDEDDPEGADENALNED